MAQWLKVEPKQSTLFLSIDISFSILEEVEHTMCDMHERAKHVYAVDGVHAKMELVSFET